MARWWWVSATLLGDSVSKCSHPFPPHWHVPSFDNYTSVKLTSGAEFDNVQCQFHASVPRDAAELLSVTRCVVVHTCSCFTIVVSTCVLRD